MDAPHRQVGTSALAVRSIALLVSVAWGFFAAETSLAQAPHQQVYSIERADVSAVAERVRTELGDRGVVFADTDGRKLYVQAVPEALPRVTELVAAMDRPATPAGEGGQANQLTSYAIPELRSNAARGWAATYQSTDGSRVAYDERNNQLIVMGSPALHAFVKQQVLALDSHAPAQVAPAAQPTHLPAPSAAPSNPGQLVLRHTRADQLHRQLEQLLNRTLPVTTDNSGQWMSFRAELTPTSGVGIDIHRATGQVQLQGDPRQVAGWSRVLQAIDAPSTPDSATQLIATTPKTDGQVRQTLQVIQDQGAAGANGSARGRLVSQLFQPAPQQGAEQTPAQAPLLQPAAPQGEGENEEATVAVPAPGLSGGAQEDAIDDGALLGPVQIQFVEGSDMILIRGNKRDVARVMEIINRIEQISADTVPAVEVLQLQHVDSRSMGQLIERVYSQILTARTGSVSITPLGKPNALLLVGRPENVRTAIELVKKIDQPVEPTTRFDVFPLQFASATDAKALIDAFLVEQQTDNNAPPPGALTPRAHVVADVRTNALVVSAGPREMAEIASLIQRIDVNSSAAVDMVRIFPLRNTVAVEMAEVLRTAVLGSPAGDTRAAETGPRVSALQLLTIDPENQRKLESSILSNIRIAAESQANTLIVTAPAETMELIAALIEQLDRSPTAEAEIKVFTIVNGDAQSLAEMLISLFGSPAEGSVGAGENSLVRLQFSVDARTNSIIAAGTTADLAVVHAILLRLDASDVRQRQTKVYRLKNSPAESVALALNDWLRTEREAVVAADLAISPFEQIEREVVIVPELVSNSLIVSATPRYYEEISKLIDELDERPAMVVIQVLIAEVRLNDTDEFGIELGLQDSLLFDRSVLDTQNFTTVTNTTTTQSAGGATVTTQQQNIVNSPLVPGFNFNNQPLGNNGSSQALANAGNVAAQGLSHFALNRVNGELGFGGFVFSASSNSVSALLRALQENRRLEVLSRPQITALDNQEAIIRVGQRVPRIQTTNITQFGQQNSVVYEDVGINMMVRPRISPDGMVVMELQAEKSQVGSEQEGIPIFSGIDGNVVRAPRIDQTVAYSTVAAASGQTIVLSGLMTKETFDIHRRVPLLADIPLLGDLFRYDSVSEQRTELLIILTPRVIRSELDAEMVKQVESSRMSWVLCDVVNMHGPSGLRSRCDEWTAADSESVFPTHVPDNGDSVPTPAGNPPFLPPGPAPSTEADDLSLRPTSQGDSQVSAANYHSSPETAQPTYLPPALYPGPGGN